MIAKRLTTLFIDYLIIGIVGFIMLYLSRLPMPVYMHAALRALPFVCLFTRDSFTGRSFGRRILNISLIDNSSSEAISPTKALVRNLFLLIWPIELILLLVTGERIGDRVTNSSVIHKK